MQTRRAGNIGKLCMEGLPGELPLRLRLHNPRRNTLKRAGNRGGQKTQQNRSSRQDTQTSSLPWDSPSDNKPETLKHVLKIICVLALTHASWGQTQAEWADKAETFLRAGDPQHAGEALRNGAAQPGTSATEDRLGFLYAAASDQIDAVEHFRKAIALDERNALAHYHLGVALWLTKDSGNAIIEMQKAIQIEPSNYDYLYRLCSGYFELEKFDSAIAELKAAVAVDPKHAEAWHELALAFQRKSDLAAAVEEFQSRQRRFGDVEPAVGQSLIRHIDQNGAGTFSDVRGDRWLR